MWTAGFLAFPPAGVAGTAVAGPVDNPLAALAGGAVVGLAGVDVERQYTTFGATGALTVSALSGLLLHRLLPYRPAAGPRAEHPTVEATA